jgi:glycosyltransferase involved in cell wall biosynthesis
VVRVLHIYKTYQTETVGGAGEVMRQLSLAAMRHGVQSRVLTLSHHPNPPEINDCGIPVTRFPIDFSLASTDFSWKALTDFKRITADSDILHYHFPWPYGDFMHFVNRPTQKVVVTYHSDIVKQKNLMRAYAPLMRWFLGRADAIVATSPNYIATSSVLQRYGDKTLAIPIGLDDSLCPKPSAETLANLKARIGHEKFFGFVGVLRYYKGLHYLMEANRGVDLPTVIAGAGPKEAELKAQAAALGLKNTIFLGRITDEEKVALQQLNLATIFPSHLRSEAFGISLLEGAMHGKPLISSDIGTGSSYINQNGVTGIAVPPENPEALRAAMLQLWQHPAQVASMGAAARIRYETMFTADVMAKTYAKLYNSLYVGAPIK